MLITENVRVWGFESALIGMRNPMNSWLKSDSQFTETDMSIGDNDLALMRKLTRAGTEHRKFLRMIHVQMDVIAPLYWWSQYDTYHVGTVANSCSKMHRIAAKPFEFEDFSHDHLNEDSRSVLEDIIHKLNAARYEYNLTKNKEDWWQIIQLLPSSYNQRRTLDFNYEVALTIIRQREGHKLDEWHTFVDVLKDLPYMEAIRDEG